MSLWKPPRERPLSLYLPHKTQSVDLELELKSYLKILGYWPRTYLWSYLWNFLQNLNLWSDIISMQFWYPNVPQSHQAHWRKYTGKTRGKINILAIRHVLKYVKRTFSTDVCDCKALINKDHKAKVYECLALRFVLSELFMWKNYLLLQKGFVFEPIQWMLKVFWKREKQ